MSGEGRLGSGLGAGGVPSGEQYRSGEEPASLTLCLSLVEEFLRKSTLDMTAIDGDITCAPEDFAPVEHPDGFLDSLVQMLVAQADSVHMRECSHLFTPVVNALYARGHNCFVLDLRGLPLSPETVARDLYGRKEEPLSITCYLREDARTFEAGGHASDSRVTFYGRTGTFGNSSRDSEFVLHGSTEFMGASSQRCTYFIPHAGEASIVGAKVGFSTVYDFFFHIEPEDGGAGEGAHPASEPHSLLGIFTTRASLVHLGSDFFKRGNTLFVPDGAGGWKEVRP